MALLVIDCLSSAWACSRSLDRLQVGKDCAHVPDFKDKFRHVRMAGKKAFRQRLRECVDGISLPERTEERRFPMGAAPGAPDSVTARTVIRQECPAAPLKRRVV